MKLHIVLSNGNTLEYKEVKGIEFTGKRFIIDHERGFSAFELKEIAAFSLN